MSIIDKILGESSAELSPEKINQAAVQYSKTYPGETSMSVAFHAGARWGSLELGTSSLLEPYHIRAAAELYARTYPEETSLVNAFHAGARWASLQ
jgi:hypothetical protein